MKSIQEIIQNKPLVAWILFTATLIIVFLLGLLASSIIERRAEAVFAYQPQANINDYEPRNQVWGQYYPKEYDSYLRTADTTFSSRYGGSSTIDMLAVDPRLVILWAGYSFSKDYRQSRGHYHAINDIYSTLRTGAPMSPEEGPQPATCWTCKSPDVPRMMSRTGAAEFYKARWAAWGEEIVNPIGCADCHDPATMNLRISRPALIEAFQRQRKDISKVSHQEMRSLVCAQCHVEYYFKGKEAYLTFPWDKGFTAEAMEEYYDEAGFTDWVHAISKTPMLKAQHPDYETYMTGIHADRGVACADCHMPYKSEGGVKFTDHHVQSPLNNIANSCQVCHREETSNLLENVYMRQEQILESRNKLEELLVRAHVEAGKAWELGATEEQMEEILRGIRHAQWRWDYSAASHGGSFHSAVESGRVVASAIVIVQEARLLLTRLLYSLGYKDTVPYPDIDTRQKAQRFIGLDMNSLLTEKKRFLREVVPQWQKKASERESRPPEGEGKE